jgi:hypothetical protein
MKFNLKERPRFTSKLSWKLFLILSQFQSVEPTDAGRRTKTNGFGVCKTIIFLKLYFALNDNQDRLHRDRPCCRSPRGASLALFFRRLFESDNTIGSPSTVNLVCEEPVHC